MNRYCIALVLLAGVIAAGELPAAEMRGRDGQWSHSKHLEVLRYRSDDVADSYLERVASLPESEQLVLLAYDRCSGFIDRPPRRFASGYISCRASVLRTAQEHEIAVGRADNLLDWRDSFSSRSEGGPPEAGAP